jgi:hypothetical protein
MLAAGESPIENPLSFLAPAADQAGKPVVAPVMITQSALAISWPSSIAMLVALSPQADISAAPDTHIIGFFCKSCILFFFI